MNKQPIAPLTREDATKAIRQAFRPARKPIGKIKRKTAVGRNRVIDLELPFHFYTDPTTGDLTDE